MYPSATESIKFEFASLFEEETKTVEILLDRSYKSSIVNTALYASSIFFFLNIFHTIQRRNINDDFQGLITIRI